jgi:hypothetical protein
MNQKPFAAVLSATVTLDVRQVLLLLVLLIEPPVVVIVGQLFSRFNVSHGIKANMGQPLVRRLHINSKHLQIRITAAPVTRAYNQSIAGLPENNHFSEKTNFSLPHVTHTLVVTMKSLRGIKNLFILGCTISVCQRLTNFPKQFRCLRTSQTTRIHNMARH